MTSLKWTIGEVEIFQIIEIEEAGEIIQSVIKDATPENVREIDWLYPRFADADGRLKAVVQAFLIKSAKRLILIDACNGNSKARRDIPEWANLQTDFLNKLSNVGATENNIDVVACTHLHTDHVGWNTRLEKGLWVPTFPNARYLFARAEFEYWQQKPEEEISDDKSAFDDSVKPVVDAGLVELVEVDHRINQHVSFIPTPGHTPAHVSVLIESQRERAIISGDMLHHPCQIARPRWRAGDTLSDQALASRQRILNQIAGTDTLLIGSHFANPVAGRVMRLGNGFVLEV